MVILGWTIISSLVRNWETSSYQSNVSNSFFILFRKEFFDRKDRSGRRTSFSVIFSWLVLPCASIYVLFFQNYFFRWNTLDIKAKCCKIWWKSVTYGNGLFVVVSLTGSGYQVMNSPDGILWTSQTSAADNQWYSVTYGNGLLPAVSQTGSGNRVMSSGQMIATPSLSWDATTSTRKGSHNVCKLLVDYRFLRYIFRHERNVITGEQTKVPLDPNQNPVDKEVFLFWRTHPPRLGDRMDRNRERLGI